ncbi:MAG: NADH:flavin oxidoreductase [Eubacterium sp.]|nr:NADH:flavin oxidoreductase [Eubacterium sp.]
MSYLNTPITIKNLEIKNRLVLPPIATERSKKGTAGTALCQYYDHMTHGGHVGLVYIEHCYIRSDGKASPNQVSAAEDSMVHGLKNIADIVHRNGSRVILQLSHAGAMADPSTLDGPAISTVDADWRWSFWKLKKEPANVKGMTQADIEDIIQCYVDAAKRAKAAGYDGCEIHGAHGFLLNQFYSPLTNLRRDKYGRNDLASRIRFHLETILAVREAVGDDFIISLRFGAKDYIPAGSSLKDAVFASRAFEQAGVDLISVSGGMCGFTRPDYKGPGYFSDTAAAIKQAVSVPVILTGGITDSIEAEYFLREHKADMIGVARAMMKDPGWAGKTLSELG